MPRCNDCNKFVSIDTESDPEDDIDCDEETGALSGSVRIVNNCGECGTELSEASFDVDVNPVEQAGESDEHANNPESTDGSIEHGFDVSVDSIERTSRTEGKGRGCRTFYGFKANGTVTCKCGKAWSWDIDDDIQASSMESLS